MKWAYGVMTVPQREQDLLPRTLESLAGAGFADPLLFVDGSREQSRLEAKFHLPVTCRWPALRTAGNWVLSMYELYYRDPQATRYAMFQDDLVTYRNLRAYLECCQYPDGSDGKERGYWNLFTFASNQRLAPPDYKGWFLSNQLGRGAVALIFDRTALADLLATKHLARRPQDPSRGWKAIDGGIVTAMAEAGYVEYVHTPSLVQHTGELSSMGNLPHKPAASFVGEHYDALQLLPTATLNQPVPPAAQVMATNPRQIEARQVQRDAGHLAREEP